MQKRDCLERIQPAIDDYHDAVVLVQLPAAPLAVTLAGVLANPGDPRARRDQLLEGLLQAGVLGSTGAAEAADHQRLQGMRASDALAEDRLSNPSLLAALGANAARAPRRPRSQTSLIRD
jgi:hypothetical protein